jgi:hypothetical protein
MLDPERPIREADITGKVAARTWLAAKPASL